MKFLNLLVYINFLQVYPSALRAEFYRQQKLKAKVNNLGEKSKNILDQSNRNDLYAIKSNKECFVTNKWSSEYNEKYPIYPSSAYVRGASTAASRCRPMSSSSGLVAQSLVPSTPVLLSSRSLPRDSMKYKPTTYCDICVDHKFYDHMRQMLSAR